MLLAADANQKSKLPSVTRSPEHLFCSIRCREKVEGLLKLPFIHALPAAPRYLSDDFFLADVIL